MLRIISSIIIFSFFLSCERNSNPLTSFGYEDIAIAVAGKSDNNIYNVIITNHFRQAVWYSGYQKGSPIYSTQVYSESGWSGAGPGWCGTGVERIKFNPGETFSRNVMKPETEGLWRVGIYIYTNSEQDGKYYWSLEIK